VTAIFMLALVSLVSLALVSLVSLALTDIKFLANFLQFFIKICRNFY